MTTLQLLRRETAPLHEATEAAFDLPARLASRGAYLDLLVTMLGVYEPLERALAGFAWESIGMDFRSRRKTPQLLRDIEIVSAGTMVDLRPDSADSDRPVVATSLAEAIGVMYVLEGATLGGQIIARELARRLAISPEDGGSFYSSYGGNRGAMWRQFCDAANRHCDADADRSQAAVRGAMAAFRHFLQALEWPAASPAEPASPQPAINP